MRPAEALLEILRSEGVTRIFGNPGTTELPLLEALGDATDLTYVLGLHEGPVVAMADGYARATRRPAFVNLHIAAGVANGLIGMLNARRSRTPMVITAGQQDRRHLLQDPMLGGDVAAIGAAGVKTAMEVRHAYDLPLVMRRAFAEAVRPPAGPVLVVIPMDVLEEDGAVTVPDRSPVPVHGRAPASEVGRAAALLAAARRPVIVAGDGIGRAAANGELVEVAERLGSTVFQQPMFDGVNFPGTHPLNEGMLAPRNTVVREALAPHDVLLLAGCQGFNPHHYTPGLPVPDGLAIVQVDADPADIGRHFPIDVGLVGDVGVNLRAVVAALGEQPPEAKARLERAAQATRDRVAALDRQARAAYGDAPLDPLAAAHAIATGLPADAVVVEEAITVGVKLRSVLRQDRPGSYVHTVGAGLGWGIGAAVGTSLADRSRPVVAVLGDGSAMFGLQGLWTAARHRLPVLFLVMNNGEYRTLKDTMDERKRTGVYTGLDLGPPGLDWLAAAELFGLEGRRVQDAGGLHALVAGAADLGGPLLVEVPVTAHGR
ncbi:thiamine pyrophosphate-binding protein [Actinomadura barringtoniae]|uniref:Thiamine pyrophosphate-binding protein n=1 Tax=Actinomadura barringtoniae TaxID=1427535 RepID=A0A939T2D2_9ACTN|nr:thiamine pyrophosphate-binding protein [Actinomadura barringtoniae]MBO2449436.1 thiamine pyrophosphate-binding protein [Actinomadura barringtoniae]